MDVVDRQVNDKRCDDRARSRPVRDRPPSRSPRTVAPCRRCPTSGCASCAPIAQRIEDHYGFPQDIEWGYADGRIAILQAREITGADLDFGHELETWKTPRALADMYDERWVWSRAYSDEVQTGPSTPSFYTYLQLGMTHLKASALRMTWTAGVAGLHARRPSSTSRTSAGTAPGRTTTSPSSASASAGSSRRSRATTPRCGRSPRTSARRSGTCRSTGTSSWHCCGGCTARRPDVSLLGTTQVMYENLERWTDDEDAFWADFDLEHAFGRGDLRAADRVAAGIALRRERDPAVHDLPLHAARGAARRCAPRGSTTRTARLYNRLVAGLHTKTSEENIAVWHLSRTIRASARLTRARRRPRPATRSSTRPRPRRGRPALPPRARRVRRHVRPPRRCRARRLPPSLAPPAQPRVPVDPPDARPRRRRVTRAPRGPPPRPRWSPTTSRCAERLRGQPLGATQGAVLRLVRRAGAGLLLLPRLRALLQRQDHVALRDAVPGHRPPVHRQGPAAATPTTSSSSDARRCGPPTGATSTPGRSSCASGPAGGSTRSTPTRSRRSTSEAGRPSTTTS